MPSDFQLLNAHQAYRNRQLLSQSVLSSPGLQQYNSCQAGYATVLRQQAPLTASQPQQSRLVKETEILREKLRVSEDERDFFRELAEDEWEKLHDNNAKQEEHDRNGAVAQVIKQRAEDTVSLKLAGKRTMDDSFRQHDIGAVKQEQEQEQEQEQDLHLDPTLRQATAPLPEATELAGASLDTRSIASLPPLREMYAVIWMSSGKAGPDNCKLEGIFADLAEANEAALITLKNRNHDVRDYDIQSLGRTARNWGDPGRKGMPGRSYSKRGEVRYAIKNEHDEDAIQYVSVLRHELSVMPTLHPSLEYQTSPTPKPKKQKIADPPSASVSLSPFEYGSPSRQLQWG